MKAHLILLILLLGTVPTVSAQDTSCIDQIQVPGVGKWAEYNAVFKQKEPYTMRYAVIGEESRGGKALKWLELRTAGNKQDGDVVTQMLVPGSGSAAEFGDVQEVVMKHGDKPAMKVDGRMLMMLREQMKKQSFLADICKDVTLVGGETVTVPAGKFKSQHYRKSGSDAWVSSKVPFAMIKVVGANHEMTLLRTGDGAKSSIAEEPQNIGRQPPE